MRGLRKSIIVLMALAAPPVGRAADCNGNGILDLLDVAPVLGFTAFEPLFEDAQVFHIGAVDLDGDADTDLVLGGADGVSVLRNNDGSLGEPLVVLAEPTRSQVIVDLDGDGLLDLAAAVDSNLVVVFGTDAGFTGEPRTVEVGGLFTSPDAADVDGDGHVDIVVGREKRVLVLRGDGAGGLGAPAEHAVVESEEAFDVLGVEDVEAVDLVGDGTVDLVVALRLGRCCPTAPGAVSILHGKPGGGFFLPDLVPVGHNPTALAIADLDGDGALDIVTANGGDFEASGSVTLLWGDAGGIFVPSGTELLVGVGPGVIEATDLDKDGQLDLVTGDRGFNIDRGTVSVLRGEGARRFAPARRYHAGLGVYHAALADLDGDGDRDVVAAVREPRGLYLLENDGDGSLRAPRNYAEDEGGVSDLELVDFDGDGDLDILTAVVEPRIWLGSVSLSLGDGAGGFTEPVRIAPEIGHDIDFCCSNFAPLVLTAADVDRDGAMDVVVGERREEEGAGAVTVLGGDGAALTQRQRFDTLDGITAIASGDLDGDGDADVVTLSYDSALDGPNVQVLENDSSGRFELGREIALPSRPVSLRLVDLDGNGALDIVVAVDDLLGSPPGVTILFNEGGLELAEAVHIDSAMDRSIDVADIDGDGALDIAAGEEVHINEGGRRFRTLRIGDLPGTLSAAADFDGDGDIDLASTRDVGNRVRVMASTGDLFFDPPVTFVTGQTPVAFEAADVNADGFADLVIASAGFADFVGIIDGIFERRAFADGSVDVVLGRPAPATSPDEDRNGVPDECEGEARTFHRGDPNDDGALNLTDAVFTLDHLFRGGAAPECLEAADVNNDGAVDITDAIGALGHLFLGGPPPAAPGPPTSPCGVDPDAPESPGDLGCARYESCGAE